MFIPLEYSDLTHFKVHICQSVDGVLSVTIPCGNGRDSNGEDIYTVSVYSKLRKFLYYHPFPNFDQRHG